MGLRVAVVTPRFSPKVFGGATIALRRILRLLRGFEVEVYATTLRQLASTARRDPEGTTQVEGLVVHRFDPDPGFWPTFSRLSEAMIHRQLDADEERSWMESSLPSSRLLEQLEDSDFDLYLFSPYLRATTYLGARIRPQKSIVIPCLHDEPAAYLKLYRDWFSGLGGLIFNSRAEQQLAQRLFDLKDVQHRVLGVPIPEIPPSSQKPAQLPSQPFVLYVGRREEAKNLPLFLDAAERMPHLAFVVVGQGNLKVPRRVTVLSQLSDRDLSRTYREALVTCQPSTRESFSMVLFESWLQGTPVLVNEACPVTREFCLQANGGLTFHNTAGLVQAIDYLQTHPRERKILGLQGREYTETRFHPELVGRRYRNFLSAFPYRQRISQLQVTLHAPHLPQETDFENYLAQKTFLFRQWNCGLEIRVNGKSRSTAGGAAKTAPPASRDFRCFDVWTEESLSDQRPSPSGARRILDLHCGCSTWQAEISEQVDAVLVHSPGLARRLVTECDVPRSRVFYVPYVVDPDLFRPGPAEPALVQALGLQDWRVLLHVGSVGSPASLQLLLEALSNQSRRLKLLILGEPGEIEEVQRLVEGLLARHRGLEGRVAAVPPQPAVERASLYRCAELVVSSLPSDRPSLRIIEAMATALPCLVDEAAPVSELIGEAGLLFRSGDGRHLAQQLTRLVESGELRERCARQALHRAQDFSPQTFQDHLLQVVLALLEPARDS